MIPDWLRAPKRFLRSPAVIVGELSFIALTGVLGASLPQAGTASAADLSRLRQHGAWLTWLVDRLALDHLFQSPAFLIVLALATASLSIVVVEQFRRLHRQWGQVPTEASFRTAPYRSEFLRPASIDGASPQDPQVRTEGRLGSAGSPLFHLGLLMVILAGCLRALFGVEATVDLMEKESLPASVEAWGAQWPGVFADPFRLDAPLTLEGVRVGRYPSGDLRELEVGFALHGPAGAGVRRLGINEEFRTSRGRLYVDSNLGPAALLELAAPGHDPLRVALMLSRDGAKAFSGQSTVAPGLLLHARIPLDPSVERPDAMELRILERGALLFVGRVSSGQTIELPGGRALRLHGLPFWVRLHGNHDPGLWLVYIGFALGLAGATLVYTVIRVDEWVVVTREGDQERVRLALKPQRFGPLFKERFERLVRAHGGQP